MKKIIVVGAGPAGMMAAVSATSEKVEVILIEKNDSLGRKLLITGNGRCNLTNTATLDEFLVSYEKKGKFLRDALTGFSNTDLIDFFKKRSLGIKVEGALIFPETEKASSVLEVLTLELNKKRVKLLLGTKVMEVLINENKIKGLKLANGKKLLCDALILATGGTSYRSTGSTGDGIDFARKLGHSIAPLRPGLVPVETVQRYPLEGLSLEDVTLRVIKNGHKSITSSTGDLIFTRWGLSGPLVISVSNKVSDLIGEGEKVSIKIDLFPKLQDQKIKNLLIDIKNKNGSKAIKNALRKFLPERLIIVFLDLVKTDSNKKMNQITSGEIDSLVHLLKGFTLNIKKMRSMDEAVVTRGGVSLKEIDPKTMASRIVNGLYFAGEVIDIAGKTGGFNLQAAFSTGHLAGESALNRIT